MAAPDVIRAACTVSTSLVIIVLGCIYAFPIWLLKLKDEMNLTQKEMDLLGVMNYIPGSFTMFLAPMLVGMVGVKGTLTIGIIISIAGYVLLYLSNSGIMPQHLAAISAGMALYRCATGIFFPYVIGNLQEMYGRQATLWVCAVVSLSFATGGLLASLAFWLLKPSLGEYFLVVLILHATVVPILSALLILSGGIYKKLVQERIASAESDPLLPGRQPISSINSVSDDSDARDDQRALRSPTEKETVAAVKQEEESIADFLRAVLPSLDFWFVCVAMMFKVGIGGTYSTNLGALMVAAGGSESDVALSVVLLNGMQLIGRVFVAVWSAPKLRCGLRGEQQTLIILCMVGAIYAVSLGISANLASLMSVYAVTLVFGLGYGMMWTISGALFALTPKNAGKDFPRMAALCYPFGGLGNLVLNLVTGALYDKSAPHGQTCTGNDCYRTSSYIMMGFSVVLIFLGIWRWQRKYYT